MTVTLILDVFKAKADLNVLYVSVTYMDSVIYLW